MTATFAYLFIFFVFILSVPLVFFGTLHIKKEFYTDGIVNFIIVFIFIALLIILKNREDGRLVYHAATFFITLLLFYFLKTGLAQGYSTLWILLSPPIVFFLMGKKEGLFWTSTIGLLALLVFINPCFLFTDYDYPEQFILRHIFVYITVSLVVYNFESAREKYKYAMETEQVKLLMEKQKLAEANEIADSVNSLLKKEIEHREKAELELRCQYDRLEDIVAERTLEIKRNAAELEASEKRYRLMADNIDDLIWSTDLDLNFTFISPSVAGIYGDTVENAMKAPPEQWNTPESYKKLMKAYRHEMEIEMRGEQNPDRHFTLRLDNVKKDGTVFPVEIKTSFIRDENGKAIGFVGITRDISDRVAMEQEKEKMKEQLAHSQKMEALGTLVGGLAHEFNNFLGGIIGSFDLISNAIHKENLKRRDYIEKYLKVGMESSRRSATLISQLLILSKRHEIKLLPMDIKESINHIYDLCSNSFPKSIELEFKTEASSLVILGDMVQIDQLLLNLCINASHAMTVMRSPDEKPGGILTVTACKTGTESVSGRTVNAAGNASHGWIEIRIADTGVGIEEKVLHRIFEPFYSTKSKNESTGLGLAISYYIIKKHGGTIEVTSKPGEGTCFTILFPSYDDEVKISTDESCRETVQGSGTVLVIDDEPAILKIAEGFLSHCGYSVIIAAGADEGIETFRNGYGEISAVLLDFSMPGKSGIEVLKELQKIDHDVKVIFSSGMLDSDSRDVAIRLGVKEIVHKPYSVSELSVKVKNVIENK
jgi:PAS domain S-box-containing protein